MSSKSISGNYAVRASKNRPIPIVDPHTLSPIAADGGVSISSHTGETGLGATARKNTSSQLRDLASSSTTLPEPIITNGQSQRTENLSQAWAANVYAQPYIPMAVSAINLSHATVIPSAPVSSIDFHDYVSSFAGRRYLMPHTPLETLVPSNLPSQPTLLLDARIYESFFIRALTAELEAEATTTNTYNLYRTRLQRKNLQEQIYELRVPGLREDRPRLNIGDTIELRQLRINYQTGIPYGMEYWLAPGGGKDRGFIAPGFTGVQYNATVWGLDRNREEVLLRIDGCVDEGLIFNVIFRVQQRRVELFQRAIADIGNQLNQNSAEQLDAASTEGNTKNSTNEIGDHTPIKPHYDLSGELCDNESEIKKAIDSIQHQDYGSLPFLISGPPGTGKTKTIVETALQLVYRRDPGRTNILLCAPSDPAADILALRVKDHVPYQDLFRLNSSSRSFAEVPGELLSYCHTTDNLFSLPEFAKLMTFRIVVTTCRDADILVQARVTNRDLVHLETGLTGALHPGRKVKDFQTPLHWNALLIDEAAQATEPEACVPLTVVAPPSTHSPSDVLVVMAGDQCQLGPRIFSPDSALETSLFERLISRPLYSAHPLSRRHLARTPSSKPPLPTTRPPFAILFQNYRSHRAILAIPSALFYHDTLTARATSTGALVSWPGWRGRRWPVLFVSNPSPDERQPDAHGWYNAGEAALACDIAASFAAHGVPQRDICIMSPFRAQVQRLRHTLRAAPYALRDVSVGPTEAFQGLESRVVILCTTRARARFLAEDRAQRAGLLGEPKRLNVALTRAKEALVVVGSPALLCRDAAWCAFVKFCARHGLWEGEEGGDGDVPWRPEGEATPAWISSLERGLVWKEMVGEGEGVGIGMGTQEEEAMWVSGHAAEEALREE
ncbi:hypothetical protein MMC18_005889 [Xylographa bjoerkii]|nr:hypothetical protein [Xylographa bjoerkii]